MKPPLRMNTLAKVCNLGGGGVSPAFKSTLCLTQYCPHGGASSLGGGLWAALTIRFWTFLPGIWPLGGGGLLAFLFLLVHVCITLTQTQTPLKIPSRKNSGD